MIVPEVDKKLLGELEAMRFPTAHASRALHYSASCCRYSMEDATMAEVSLMIWVSSMGEDRALMERRLHRKGGK